MTGFRHEYDIGRLQLRRALVQPLPCPGFSPDSLVYFRGIFV
jgi:hypothetical protein